MTQQSLRRQANGGVHLPLKLVTASAWAPTVLPRAPPAADRAHRIGQASSVNVYFLHVRNSIDDIIWNSVQVRACGR